MVARSNRSMVAGTLCQAVESSRLVSPSAGLGQALVSGLHASTKDLETLPRLLTTKQPVRAELDARLQENAVVVGLPVHDLRHRGEAHHMVLEMSVAVRLHVPVAAAKPDAEEIIHAIGQKAVDLIAPPAAVLRHRTGE